MSGPLTFMQTTRYLFALIITFSVLIIASGSIMLFVSKIYDYTTQLRGFQTELQQRFPQCIIIGAMKGGTKALIDFIGLHPNVKIKPKDAEFFNNDTHYNQGMEYYRQQMPFSYPEDITIEKTPSYFASGDARKRIKNFNPQIKLVIVLRDPITRAMSHFLQLQRHGLVGEQRFEGFVIDNATGVVDVNNTIITPSLYVEHISEWFSLFPRAQIHIVNGEDFIRDPVHELQRFESFLGLNHWITDMDFYYDTKKGFYCTQIAGCLGGNKGRNHPIIGPVELQKLRDFFKPYNQRLVELIGERFKWGDDKIDGYVQ